MRSVERASTPWLFREPSVAKFCSHLERIGAMAIEIRQARERDAAAVVEIYRPYCESSAISFEYLAPSVEEMAQRIGKITEHFPWLVLTDNNQVAGYAYASPHRERAAYGWAVDSAVYIQKDFHRHGVGKALYTALFAMLKHLGYFKVYAGITLPNPGSVGLHESMGFQLVGTYRGVGYKLGAWHDVSWYQRELQPEQVNPEPPRSISTLVATPQWEEAIRNGLACYRSA